MSSNKHHRHYKHHKHHSSRKKIKHHGKCCKYYNIDCLREHENGCPIKKHALFYIGPPGPCGPHGPPGCIGPQGEIGPRGTLIKYIERFITGRTSINENSKNIGNSIGQLCLITSTGEFFEWDGSEWITPIELPSVPFYYMSVNDNNMIWYIEQLNTIPNNLIEMCNLRPGDYILEGSENNMWMYASNMSLYLSNNIRGDIGPQGPIGPQGLTGPQGVISDKNLLCDDDTDTYINAELNTDDDTIHANAPNGFVFTGSDVGSVPASGAGTRMMFVPSRSAWRVGEVNDTQWDDFNIGVASTAINNNTIASGIYSNAEGNQSVAEGEASRAEGINSRARLWGQYARSSGQFTENGDSQYSKYIVRNIVSGVNTQGTLFLDGIVREISVPGNSSWCYTATICGRRDNISLGTYCIKFDGIIDRRNPPLYSHTSVSQNPITTGDMSGASVDIPDLAPGSILRVNVTNPDTDTTVYWTGCINVVEINNK